MDVKITKEGVRRKSKTTLLVILSAGKARDEEIKLRLW
jgi:hypothetical protein